MQKIIVDTETTGLHPEIDDDLLQVSIIDDQGLTLFDSLIRPHLLTSWDDAMAINHITPDMVHDRWFKLTAAADYFDFDWSAAPAHNSLGDCLATLHVYKNLLERGFYHARKPTRNTV